MKFFLFQHVIRFPPHYYGGNINRVMLREALLDDWGLSALHADNRRDLLARMEDRYDTRATIVTSQLPLEHCYETLGDSTLADAMLDRLVHKAYKLLLQGESMRKRKTRLTTEVASE